MERYPKLLSFRGRPLGRSPEPITPVSPDGSRPWFWIPSPRAEEPASRNDDLVDNLLLKRRTTHGQNFTRRLRRVDGLARACCRAVRIRPGQAAHKSFEPDAAGVQSDRL